MSYSSTTGPNFLPELQSWFQTQSEILVLIRRRCGGGAKDFEFFTTYSAFLSRLHELPSGTCLTAFKDPQLPLRGVVDDNFIKECLRQIRDGDEYLLVETVATTAGGISWFHNGSDISHAVLLEDLKDSWGKPVAVGLYPPALENSAVVMSAVVPDAEGVVRAGPY